ncbi:DUF6191 domain-containing protein [Actinokineospora fastidiosa]|uniref:Uncharacterized protein n=1 Tax=Actinokineospora fastidiosa TaxID=1816 RepID=A0A918L847_9PSEU|nr:DUF6191 domain-containing protein [Actinokineospora fastidiosa]GGS19290.1 hypothetical protein GCM10010171_09850 [Actinokineospora fastidiosa]
MGWLLALTIPGLVVLLVIVVSVEAFGKALPWRRKRAGLPVSAAALEDFAGVLQASRRVDQDRKQHSLMMRDEIGDNGPPRTVVDFAGRTVRLVVPPVQER